jgi:hypothetical protein
MSLPRICPVRPYAVSEADEGSYNVHVRIPVKATEVF